MMTFTKKKVLKCLWITKDVEIGLLVPATITLVIVEDVLVVMLLEVYLCHKRPATFPLSIEEQELILKVEVDIGL